MFCISTIIKGVIWGAAAVEPVIQMLGLGSVFAAWNMAKQSDWIDDFYDRSPSESKDEPKESE